MSTIDDLRAMRDSARESLEQTLRQIQTLPNTASSTLIRSLSERRENGSAELARLEGNLRAEEERAAHVAAVPAGSRAAGQRITVGATRDRAYRPDQPGTSFFRDAWQVTQGAGFASEAAERLERNSREQADELRARGLQYRDVGTGAFAGLVIPQYLADLVAPLARAGSPLLNALVTKLPLPAEGMTVNISRITTGTGVAAQATENSVVQETDADDTLLTVDVRTYAGQQDVSRQAIERGVGVDQVIFRDLVRAYFTALDSAILNGAGTSGTHLGIRSTAGIISVAYTDASPTVPELYAKVNDAAAQIESSLYGAPTVVLMHPRRWRWMTAALDSTSRPFVVPSANGPFNALAVGEAPQYGGVAGSVIGLPVVTDANVPTNLGAGTNEDVILLVSNPELVLWHEGEGMPRQLRFEQAAAPQSIRLAVWGYSAFTAGRYPAASAVIGGTGLVAPTF